jgi:hypothetical protein
VDPSPKVARRRALLVALAVLVVGGVLGVARHREPPLPVPADVARRLGAAEPTLRPLVADATSSMVTRIDDGLAKVTWFRGSRAIATVGVQRDHTLRQPVRLSHVRTGYGAPMSHLPGVLIVLTGLFLLAVLRGPLRRIRTLDAVALAALVVPTILLDRGFMGPAEAAAAVLLAYLAARGIALAVRGPAAGEAAEAPVLLERLARRARTPRLVPQVAMAMLAITIVVTLCSTGIIDVAYANMEGATVLIGGHLPYGHMPGDVVHGDTYGLPIYALYAPFAALWPMHDGWSEATGALVLGALCAVVCALGLGRFTGPGGPRWPAVVALLAFPPSLMTFSSGTNDVLIAAAVIWAFGWWLRPALSSALLMTAGLAKIAPLVLLPLWLARLRGAALRRALLACAAAGALTLAGLVAVGGARGPLDMLHAMTFQASRASVASIWTSFGLQAAQPVVQAAALAIALGGAVLVLADRAVARDPRRVAGLVTATLAALQLAANHWTPLYLCWLAPPAFVALLGPLGALRAPASGRVPALAADVRAARTPGTQGVVA